MNSPPLRRLYPRLTSFASLHAAAHRARLGKRYRPAVLAFHSNLEAELLRRPPLAPALRVGMPIWPTATPGVCGVCCFMICPMREACPRPVPYGGDGRVAQLLRGGSWNNNPGNCRSAYRNHNLPDNANNNVGFRVVCLPQHPSPSEPLEGIPTGACEGSRPAPEIGRFRPLIRTAPKGAPTAFGPALGAGSPPFFSHLCRPPAGSSPPQCTLSHEESPADLLSPLLIPTSV